MDTSGRVMTFLENHNVINLSYIDKNSTIQSCALWFVSDSELNLYYLTSLSTNHGSSLSNGGMVAFTINRDDQKWDQINGIQGRGYVKMISDEDAWNLYTKKYQFILDQFEELDQALQKTKLWKITPNWFRLIDNSLEFGHKEEIEL